MVFQNLPGELITLGFCRRSQIKTLFVFFGFTAEALTRQRSLDTTEL
jgi:hypothetical protein